MAYTFGGANGDDVALPVVTAVTGQGVSGLFTVWCNPTALTSGRALIGFGNNLSRIALSAASGEIDLSLDAPTTDGLWTSAGLGLSTGAWRFIAVAWSCVSGPTIDARMWAGDGVTPPAAVTFSQATAPVGALSTQSSATLGNGSGSAAIAFVGDLEQADLFSTSAAAGATHPFGQAAYGAFSAEAEALVLARYVLPLWEGTYRRRDPGNATSSTSWQHISADMGLLGAAYSHIETTSANEPVTALTFNGATFSASRGPRPRFGHASAFMPSRVIARR